MSNEDTSVHQGELLADQFSSPECLEDIKAYTYLLQQCDAALLRGTGGELANKSERAKRTQQDALNRVQNKVNLLTRGNEKLTVAHSGNADGQIIVVNNESVASRAYRKTQIEQNSSVKDSPLKVTVQAMDHNFRASFSADVDPVDHILFRYDQIAQSIKATGNISGVPTVLFAEHFSMVKTLLLECHNAPTDETLRSARKMLRGYIMASSYHKMLSRLEMGQSHNGRDIYDVMTVDPTLPEFDKDDIADLDVLKQVPTAGQLVHFQRFADDAQQSAWMEGKAESPVYSISNRKVLHYLLSSYLETTEEALKDLKRAVRLDKLAKISQEAAKIKPLVDAARNRMHILANFVLNFKLVLQEHFKWLEQFRTKAGKTAATAQTTATATMSTASTAPTTTAAATSSSDVQSSDLPTGSDDFDVLMGGTNDNYDDTADDEVEVQQLAELEETDGGWPKAALKYLQLICLHETAILGASDWQPGKARSALQTRESLLLTQSSFTVVDIQQARLDLKRRSIEDCMDEIVKRKSGLDKKGILRLLAMQHKDGKLVKADWVVSSEDFNGSFHCETILLILAVLATKPNISQKLTNEWLNRNGIFAAKSDLITMFNNMLPFVAISKRDCPVCYKICQLVAESKVLRGSDSLIIPGYHTLTSAVALPPFTPKDIADACLQDIMEKVDDRMDKLQKIAKATSEKSSDSAGSVGSHPEPDHVASNAAAVDELPSSESLMIIGPKSTFMSSPPKASTSAMPDFSQTAMPPDYKPGSSPERRRKAEDDQSFNTRGSGPKGTEE